MPAREIAETKLRSFVRRARAVVPFVVTLALGACANPPPSDEVRQSIRSLAVVTMPTGGAAEARTPVKSEGEAALAGAGQGAAVGLVVALEALKSKDPYAALLFVPLGAAVAIVGAPVGAVVGASRAKNEKEVSAAEGALKAALATIKPHEGLRDAFAGQAVTGKMLTVEAATVDLAALRARGVDTVLEVSLRQYGFATDGRIDPSLRALLVAETRLLRTADNAVLHRREWRMMGPERNYFALAADRGETVRSDFAHLYRQFAGAVIHHLFVERPGGPVFSPPAPAPAAPPASIVSTDPAASKREILSGAAPYCGAVGGYEAYRQATGQICRCDDPNIGVRSNDTTRTNHRC